MKKKIVPIIMSITLFVLILNTTREYDFKGHKNAFKIKNLIERRITNVNRKKMWYPEIEVKKADVYKALNELTEKKDIADISKYLDVSSEDWFFDDAKKAVAQGFSLPKDDLNLGVQENVTTEELLAMTSIALKLPYVSNVDEVLKKYEDNANISTHFKQLIANYLGAYPLNEFDTNNNGVYEIKPNSNVTKATLYSIVYDVMPIETMQVLNENKKISKGETVKFGIEFKQNVVGKEPDLMVGFGQGTLVKAKFVKKVKNTYVYEHQFNSNEIGVLKYKITGGNLKTLFNVSPKYVPDERTFECVFGYKTGNITLKYVDEYYNDIVAPVTKSYPLFEEQTFSPRDFSGYKKTDITTKNVKLLEENETSEVIFKLERIKQYGTINIKYQDESGTQLAPDTVLDKVEYEKEEQVTAKTIDNYSLIGDYLTRVTLNDSNQTKNIIYKYESINSKNIYTIELDKYGIKNDNTNAKSTTEGINKALKDAAAAGIKKVKLPVGTYAIDADVNNSILLTGTDGKTWTHHRRGITIPVSGMELDLRGCILNQIGTDLVHSAMVTISNVDNVNIVGGDFTADRKTHYYGTRVNEDGNSLESGDFDISTGEPIEDSTRVRTKNFIEVFVNKDGTTKDLPTTFKVMPYENTTMNSVDGGARYIYCYDETGKYLGRATGGNAYLDQANLISGTKKIKIALRGEKRLDAKFYLTEQLVYPSHEFGAVIVLADTNNVEIVGSTLKEATGDGILTYPAPLKVTVDNFSVIDCDISFHRRQGISYVATGEYNLVKNTKIHDINGIDPQCGIDFEHYDYCRKTIIDNCDFYNNKKWDIINYNGTEIEVKNSRFKGAIAATYGTKTNIHNNHFEYDINQDKIHKIAGVNLTTKENVVYNNTFKNANSNVAGEGSKFYGNTLEGGNSTIYLPGNNTYKDINNLFFKAGNLNNTWYGNKFINSVVAFEANTADKKMYLKESTFIDTKLAPKNDIYFSNTYIEGNTVSINDGTWHGGTLNVKNSVINAPTINFLGAAGSSNYNFNNCDITSKRSSSLYYGSISIKNSRLNYITGDSDKKTRINAFTHGYGNKNLEITNTTSTIENAMNITPTKNDDYTNITIGDIIKTDLRNTHDEIKNLKINVGVYSNGGTLNPSINTANTEINSITSTNETVKTTHDNLLATYQNLTLKTNKIKLLEKLNEAKSYLTYKDYYTSLTLTNLQTIITGCENIYTNINETQSNVDKAVKDLTEGINNLVLINVNRQPLADKITSIKKTNLSNYSVDSIKNLNIKVTEAEKLYNRQYVSNTEITNMITQLNDAFNNLVNLYYLKNKIKSVETINLLIYIVSSQNNLRTELDHARIIVATPSVTQNEVDNTINRLDNAVKNLVKIVIDFTKLTERIKEVEALNLKPFTMESKNNLAKELNYAKEIQAKEGASQTEINDAILRLNKAVYNLKKITENNNKSNLFDKIKEAEKIKTDNYTEKSVENLKNEIKNARNIYTKENATEEEIKEAIKRLDTSINNLEKEKIPETDKPDINEEEQEKIPETDKPELKEEKNNLKYLIFGGIGLFILTVIILLVKRKKEA